MSGNNTLDTCASGSDCLVPPSEFVRMRYFFGQRLGVVDLFDEQSYLIGKQRFHNRLLHGIGVLCGLQAQRQPVAQGARLADPTTLLRVSRGAALDACGREIVVGWDCCIDVNAWYLQHPAAHPAKAEIATLALWVAVCYRECPSDPATAPRDPCGCDAGGCEFARIREGFELKLLTTVEAKLLDSIAFAGDSACPTPPTDACLLLARFNASLSPDGKQVIDIGPPDNAPPERPVLLPTAVLQRRLLDIAATAEAAGLVGAGPRLAGISFSGEGTDSGTLSIGLVTVGAGLSASFMASLKIGVSLFNEGGSWESVPVPEVKLIEGPPASIALTFAAVLVKDVRYRVYIETDPYKPPVDTEMRPLTPSPWAYHFRLVLDADAKNLTLAESLNP